jgi:UV DNA damage repair endonuclease
MTRRIGFACKISSIDPKKGVISIPEYNSKGTTVAWLNRQHKDVAVEKLWELMKHNIEAARRAVEYVGNLEEDLRLFRLGSDILPVYTEPTWGWFWQQHDVREYCARGFARVGELARSRDVRLSFHPGQFCCVVSDSQDVVNRSIEELEYHADIIRWLGYGQKKLDFKLNIHLSGRGGIAAFDNAWMRLSPEAQNSLTLENDEYQIGLDDLLLLKHRVGIVLDIHHHLIKDEEYIANNDPRIAQVLESWQGVRPVFHYSQSRDEYIGKFIDRIPTMAEMLLESKKGKLRAHSDFYTNKKINEWALSHLEWGDCMAESKGKNLAAEELFIQYKEHI